MCPGPLLSPSGGVCGAGGTIVPVLSMQDLELLHGERGPGSSQAGSRVCAVYTRPSEPLRSPGGPARRPRVGGRPHCQWEAEMLTLAGAREEHQSPDPKTRWAETLRCGSCPHRLCDPGQTSLSLSLHRPRGQEAASRLPKGEHALREAHPPHTHSCRCRIIFTELGANSGSSPSVGGSGLGGCGRV